MALSQKLLRAAISRALESTIMLANDGIIILQLLGKSRDNQRAQRHKVVKTGISNFLQVGKSRDNQHAQRHKVAKAEMATALF